MTTSYDAAISLDYAGSLNDPLGTPAPTPSPIILGEYSYVIADLSGIELGEIQAVNPIWSYVLNDSGTCSIAVPTRSANRALMPIGQCELHIYKGNSLVWGGHLYTAESVAEDTTRFGFSGYFERLKRRYIDVSQHFVATEQLDIAWNLINYTQSKTNGNTGMGWTRASATGSGVTRDINYNAWERPVIADVLQDLAALDNGFDFEVTPSKQWKTYYPSKGAALSIGFEYGRNIQGMSLMEDASDNFNTYSAIGAGDGKNTCIAVVGDITSQAAYGLLETAESFTSIKHFETLQDRATEGLRMKKNPRLQPDLAITATGDPLLYTYTVGDRMNVYANDGYLQINKLMRIINITVEISNGNQEVVTLNMDDKVDV